MSVNALRVIWRSSGVIAAKGDQPRRGTIVERAAAADLWPAMVQATCWGFCWCAIAASRRGDRRARSARSSPTIDAIRSAGWRRASPASARSPLLGDPGQRCQIRRPSNPAPRFRRLGFGRDRAKQNSTCGKVRNSGRLTKQGNRYIRRLLVLGAISVLRAAAKAQGRVVRLAGRAQPRANRQRSGGRGVGNNNSSPGSSDGDHHYRRGLLRTSIYAKA